MLRCRMHLQLKRLPHLLRVVPLLLGALIATGCASLKPPVRLESLAPEQSHPVLVVATYTYGGPLPPAPECAKFCLHYVPAWFEAHVILPVYGATPRRFLFTATHEQVSERLKYSAAGATYLLKLETDGRRYVMGPPFFRSVVPKSTGEYFLPLRHGLTVRDLPCSIADARVEIDPTQFPDELAWPRKGFEYEYEGLNAANYIVTETHWMPRYAIPVSAIADRLATFDVADIREGCVNDGK
jgi:hypothetical protein